MRGSISVNIPNCLILANKGFVEWEIIRKVLLKMKRFNIDRTKILSIVTASILLLSIATGCGKKKAVVTSLTTVQTTTELTTATTTTEETTTEEETTTTEETTTETTTERTTATTTEEETTTTKKKTVKKKKATPTPGKIKVTDYRAKVYAKNKMNVRSGPGTNYKIVKTLEKGDGIDVRGKTNNGWYKTINGNYVLASLTTKTKPATND